MPYISQTPQPPYYAVIFTSINADVDHTEHTELYGNRGKRPGLGTGGSGLGIGVSLNGHIL